MFVVIVNLVPKGCYTRLEVFKRGTSSFEKLWVPPIA